MHFVREMFFLGVKSMILSNDRDQYPTKTNLTDNRGNLRITRLFWDHAFVAKKNLENPKRPRPFNRMCKGRVSNASFLVFVGVFYPIGDTTTISMVDWIVSWCYSIFHSNHGKFYLRSTSIQIEHVWAKLLERLKPLKRHLEIWL